MLARSTTEAVSVGVAHPSVIMTVTAVTPGRAPPDDVYTDLVNSRRASYQTVHTQAPIRHTDLRIDQLALAQHADETEEKEVNGNHADSDVKDLMFEDKDKDL